MSDTAVREQAAEPGDTATVQRPGLRAGGERRRLGTGVWGADSGADEELLGAQDRKGRTRDRGPLRTVGCRAAPSPILLVWLLLQAGEQADEAVLIFVQGALDASCEVGVVLLVEPGEGQVQAGPDVLQDEGQDLGLQARVKLRHQAGQDLYAHLT